VFALGDAAAVSGAPLAATAQVAFQAADYAAWNVWAAHNGRPLLPFKYQARTHSCQLLTHTLHLLTHSVRVRVCVYVQHLGDMMVLGPDAAAVALPLGGATLDGPLVRTHTTHMRTMQHGP
jgi:NADH:ubiquinone reductase (non-electrogenic)